MTRKRVILTLLIGILVAIFGMLHHRLVNRSIPRFISQLYTTKSMSQSAQKSVIVVGSGLAGLSAAYEAIKAGSNVHMLERGAKTGGNSIKASSGINGAGTEYQRKIGVLKDDHFYEDSRRSAGTRFEQWKAAGSKASVDRERLIKQLTTESANAVNWLVHEIGVDLSIVAILGGHSIPRTHRGSGKATPGFAIVSALTKKLQEHPNFTLSTSAEVTRLDRDGDSGAVKGVHYSKDGQALTAEGTVVFASGGFAGDANGLLAKYRPDLQGMPSTNDAQPGSHGLLEEIGAPLVDMDSVQIHPTGFVDPSNPGARLKFLAAEVLRGEGGILLSAGGERFVNEMETREHVSKAIMSQAAKPSGVEGIKQWDVTLLLDPGACEAAANHIGFYQFKGLVQKKKIKELDAEIITAIDEYAEGVASGRDGKFGRQDFGHWRLKSGESNREEEVCIGLVTPIVHFTMGGVAFNHQAQVLEPNEDGAPLRPIPGLFAAGEITGGLHGDNRLGGSSLLECVVFGRIAGIGAAGIANA
jgi:FAD-dependent fumarate reductase